jgi:transposase
MTPIPVEVRKRIIALYERGKGTAAIADALGYCAAAVRRVRQHLRERGTLEPATHRCGRRGRFTPEVGAELQRLHDARADATLAELADALADGPLALSVSPSTVDRWLRVRLGVTRKKSRRTPPSNRGPTWPPPGRRGPGPSPRPAAAT